MVTDADVPDPAAEMTMLYVPGAAEDEAENVTIELHVTVQLGFEKDAETPAGTEAAENDTLTALPDVRVAVTLSDVEEPGAADAAGEPAEREIVEAVIGAAAVVNVKSEESVSCPSESCEPTR